MTTETGDPVLLRVAEAARLLGISRAHMYNEMNAGRLPSLRIGTARRVPRHALEQWIDRQVADAADLDNRR